MTADVRPARCWSVIGIGGDRSCPELESHVHCHNCPVFSNAGRQLMEGAAPSGYLEEWTEFLASARVRTSTRAMAALVFRIADEWLAIEATAIAEVAEIRPSRRIAHRSGGALVGLVNIRGQLLLQVNLHHLFHLGTPASADTRAPPRLVVLQRGEVSWVFRADEVLGIQRFATTDLGPIPVTVAHSVARVSKGLLTLGQRRVGHLDADGLFTLLRQVVG